jgi:hypothetical protein
MNVRFFAGSKKQYLSLPVPRNPLGLYFCEDTKELFWADRLLTDGIRVVPTFADLPARADAAAEGVVYYVTETRNGYVLSPDRTEWLQTIYAPATDAYKVPESEIYNTVTTVGAVRDIEAKIYKTIDERIANIEIGTSGTGVKAIYFAGRKLDAHDDGTFHIDRLCALNALGFKLPDGHEDTEIELVTKEYVDELLAKIPGADIDLTKYYTKDEVDGLIAAHTPAPELYVVDFDAPNFTEATEAYNAGKLLLLTNAAPDATGYAVMNYVRDDLITFTKFLMSRSGTYGSFNTYYLHNDNTWELAKEVRLNKVEAVADADNNINGLVIGKNTYDFDHFATTETVNQITENIQNTYVTNESLEQKNYVTEQYVTNNYITVQEAANTYVTTEKVTEVVETQVDNVVTKEIETKVETVIQDKVDAGEIVIQSDSISYDTW